MNSTGMPPLPAPDRQALSRELRDSLCHLSFHAFATCLLTLLDRLGYVDARLLDRTHRHQRTGHGGYDLLAHSVTGVTEAMLLVQAKQYARPVSRRFVDELKGAMLREGAGLGLCITLSTFSRAAKTAAAARDAAPVILVDGEALVALLIRHRVGIAPDALGSLRLDGRYFWALERRYP